MSDELSFEDLIISHNELYNEFYITSMPVSVFGVNFIKTPKICSFKDSVALYLITDFIEEEYRHYEDFNQFKAIQTLSVPLFCGDFNSLVISSTCTHLLIIFFTNNDDNSHITNAIDFGSKFWDVNPYNKTGAMFSCGPMKAILYPPPILEKGESNESHTPSVNSKFFEETSNTNEPSENDSLGKDKNNENDKNNGHYRSFGFDDKFKSPSMTVEPLVKNLQYLPKIAKLMKTNSLIVSTQFLSCLSDYEAYDLPNDFGLDLSIISLEDSPISQINEDVQNQIYDTALPDDYFNDDQNILVDDEEFQL
ncbi:hypothetical protein TRFO_25184 [Tritrichomonas foetus]|uniref:Uncharacterized protein n=1 Tax=Tritrichomonas foetus TaxID=1144522 RepID=A0A1J4K6Q7_9EUKA|nr:hypothetical protein TRFO_25184 [Tritrichomonas foetus]|eukprot:OHT06658.1 hypothetical protein TRFO_25184 [Tritrichomonas foetus]